MVMAMDPQVTFLTAQEVAAKLRVSVQTVHRMVERGVLPGGRAGNRYRIPRKAFDAYLKAMGLEPDP